MLDLQGRDNETVSRTHGLSQFNTDASRLRERGIGIINRGKPLTGAIGTSWVRKLVNGNPMTGPVCKVTGRRASKKIVKDYEDQHSRKELVN